MRRLFRSACIAHAVAALLLSTISAEARAAVAFYASGGGTHTYTSALYVLDPATGKSFEIPIRQNVDFHNGGLAYDAASDRFFATGAWESDTGTSRLYSIDRSTNVLTEVGPVGVGINVSSGGLAMHPTTGALYATGQTGFQSEALLTLDQTTGAATIIGLLGGQCCTPPFGFQLDGLGFSSDGTLYANGFSSFGISSLYTIDLVTGAATLVGPHGVSVGRALFYSGLAPQADGSFLSLGSTAASAQGLYSVDPTTGSATLIAPTANFGVDGGVTLPEPTSGTVLAAAVLWLGRRVRVKRPGSRVGA